MDELVAIVVFSLVQIHGRYVTLVGFIGFIEKHPIKFIPSDTFLSLQLCVNTAMTSLP